MKKVLGMGNARVDVLIRIGDDKLLEDFQLPKGSMTLVDKDKSNIVLDATASLDKQQSAGGSVANAIHGLAKLGTPAGYIGKTGDDEYGRFFGSYMNQNHIETRMFQGKSESGKCLALISEDSERTFATYLGAAIELDKGDLTAELFKGYDYFLLEGYLVQNHPLLEESVRLARQEGNEIAIDLASYNVVEENLDFLRGIVGDYVDIVLANEEEARAFTGKEDPREALTELAKQCKIAVVKIGKHGSLIASGAERFRVEPLKARCKDTTGAGDLYASGFLYGMAKGHPLEMCGRIGSVVAARVIEVIGTKMNEEIWEDVFRMVREIEAGA